MGRKDNFRRSQHKLWKEKGHLPMSKTRRSQRYVGIKTRQDRRDFLMMIPNIVHGAGYKITHYKNFDSRHLRAVVEHLDVQKYAAGTMKNKISFLRLYLKWIEKESMIDLICEMISDPEKYVRTGEATRDRSWSPELYEKTASKLALINTSMAVSLMLMDGFGLRMLESLMLKPDRDHVEDLLVLTRGTKNGRPRDVPIETDYQRNVLEIAKYQASVNGGSLIPKEFTSKSWQNRIYYRLRKLGITMNAEGFTCHGLRHTYAQQSMQELSGKPAPVRDGEMHDMEAWYQARVRTYEKVRIEVMMRPGIKEEVSSRLGHARPQITDAYIGRDDG